jgi:hypothetical protein
MRPRMRDSSNENTGGKETETAAMVMQRSDTPSPRGISKHPQNGYF